MAQHADLAYETLRARILTGAHAVGTRLREEELAESLGVSRTPVREALRRLSSEGLVDVTPNRGALVARWDEEDLDEVFEMRALVEGYGARRAAQRITAEELVALRSICTEMEALVDRPPERIGPVDLPDYDRITELNLAFHRGIQAAARSRRLASAMAGLVQVPLVHHTFHRYTPDELRRSIAHHRELTGALEAANPDWAEAVMHAHVQAARESLRRAAVETAEAPSVP